MQSCVRATQLSRWVVALSCAVLGNLNSLAAAAPPLPRTAQAFVTQHCADCHANGAQEGGLDISKLSADLSTRAATERWAQIFTRVQDGSMPPDGEPRPAVAAKQTFLKDLEPVLTIADRAQREVYQRRLNREEYQQTIYDLLDVEIDAKAFLPEDQQAGGFDNNGEALAISTELMGQYLQAAEKALDLAIVHGPRPETQTFTVDAMNECKQYIGKIFNLDDGRIVVYNGNETQYSKISTREKRTPLPGRYRFKFQAAVHRGKSPLVFNVIASNFAPIGAVYKNLGYFEVGPEPKTYEIEAVLDKGYAIQFFGLGLPGWIKDINVGDPPGIGFGAVEITGPLHDTWPPESHTGLLGNVDLQKGTLADAEPILQKFASQAFRRPVRPDELARYVGLVRDRLAAGRSFEKSLRAALAAILCSPNFIYLREDVQLKTERISDYELASRLSYFLWNSQPDAELFKLASQNKLHEPAVLRGQVERLLKDPKSARFVTNFVGQWLRMRDIDATVPDEKLYPEYDELLKISMVRECEGFFRTLLDEDLPVRNFLNSDFAILNGRLAKHYGIDGVIGLDMRKVSLPPDSVRGGILTQAGLMKVTANGTNTSPVTRGVWVLENILGQHIPPPPPNISGIEPDIRGATTIREQLAKHRNDASCNVCHRHIDPPGFALESFDPVGKHRAQYLRFFVNKEHADKGWGHVGPAGKVDPSGQLPSGKSFADIREFKQRLVDNQADFVRCLSEKLLTYALGRELGFSDRATIAGVVRDSAKLNADQQHSGLRSLIHAVVQSPAFSTR